MLSAIIQNIKNCLTNTLLFSLLSGCFPNLPPSPQPHIRRHFHLPVVELVLILSQLGKHRHDRTSMYDESRTVRALLEKSVDPSLHSVHALLPKGCLIFPARECSHSPDSIHRIYPGSFLSSSYVFLSYSPKSHSRSIGSVTISIRDK